ncbi:MAG: hypothetical protein D6769_00725 [Methanobacteriota archaeon]|nr:MAG: hypothetical protein D6769_00725 [Euryarchaeota archaeon]
MGMGKASYLKAITSKVPSYKSVRVDKKMEGSSPPSVFIGRAGYPNVYVGPLMSNEDSRTEIYDMPEMWIRKGIDVKNIIDMRLSLVRGMKKTKVTDVGDRLVERLREISLSEKSVYGEVEFSKKPRGVSFNEEHQPFGPSAPLKELEVGNPYWDRSMEKAHYDTDLLSKEAVITLYNKGLPFSAIQKAFSTGSFGIGKKRKLVPTRWSITAVDTMLGDALLREVRHNSVIEEYRVYEFESLRNKYIVLLVPTAWQYEWFEAFINVMGKGTHIFNDYEHNRGKKGYSPVGGCFYSCRFALLEGMRDAKIQAGAIVLREAYEDYIPLGVFNVRENVREAMKKTPAEFHTMKEALSYIRGKLRLPLETYIEQSYLFGDIIRERQKALAAFL